MLLFIFTLEGPCKTNKRSCRIEAREKNVCEREKKASNFPVRERGEDYQPRANESVRSRHIGNRGEYNGKRLGTNYTGRKRNSSVSFMFFNFPDGWTMVNLWMMFKKYGTIFDMFMVQKLLRNGQRYGFVRFKLVFDVDVVLKNLRNIRFGKEHLKVFIAFDMRNTDGRNKMGNRGLGSNSNTRTSNIFNNEGVRSNIRDDRRCVDVVSRDRIMDNKTNTKVEGRAGDRVIVVSEEEMCSELLCRCLIGEVKSLCYLTKLMGIYDEIGLGKVEIKLLGGLEVMLIFDTMETTTNNIHHGLRRWIHKSVFRKIAALHGRVLGFKNCNLKGNQSLIIGKVQIHTCNKGLVKEKVNVICMGKVFKVEVIEEVGGIEEFETEEVKVASQEDRASANAEKRYMDDMVVSDEDDDNDSNSGSDEDEGESENGDEGKKKEDEESRVSLGTRVCETPEVEDSKSKAARNSNNYFGEGKEAVNNVEDGGDTKV
ncbi:transposon TX1 [Tanacetum coccineum]